MTGFPAKVRTLVRLRADGYCERCGVKRAVELHHRRPRGMGGTNRPETNTASAAGFLCGDCHRWAESHRWAAVNDGWLVPQNHSPADIPVKYRGAYVFLDDLGNMQRVEDVI